MSDTALKAAFHDIQTYAPTPGSTWRHSRTGNVYVVVGATILEATLTPLVLYKPKHCHPWEMAGWARPLTAWREEVKHEGKMVPRFVLVVSEGRRP